MILIRSRLFSSYELRWLLSHLVHHLLPVLHKWVVLLVKIWDRHLLNVFKSHLLLISFRRFFIFITIKNAKNQFLVKSADNLVSQKLWQGFLLLNRLAFVAERKLGQFAGFFAPDDFCQNVSPSLLSLSIEITVAATLVLFIFFRLQ